jgi:hypothetical protein
MIDDYCGDKNLQKRDQERGEKNFTKIIQHLFAESPVKKNALLVEGCIDKKFSEHLFNPENCACIPLNGIDNVKYIFCSRPSGGKKTEDMKQALNDEECRTNINRLIRMRDSNRAIGFVDKDFRDPQPGHQFLKDDYYPLFETETTDMEILLCKHGGLHFFLDNVCKSQAKNIEKKLKRQASIPGFARSLNGKVSDGNNKKIFISYESFKKPDGTSRFLDFFLEGGSIRCEDIQKCLKEYDKNKTGDKKAFFDFYAKKCPKRLKNCEDPWSMCQGHDTMNILLILLARICEKGNFADYDEQKLKEKILEQFIQHKCFAKSTMISQIMVWEKENRLSRPSMTDCGRLFRDYIYNAFTV